MHNVTDSTENYLKAIYVMSKKTGSVRSVDIARFLDVTKASVSVAMRKLREANYINMASDGMITLLPDGLTIALRTYERHVLLRAFLIHLGVDEETADKDACKSSMPSRVKLRSASKARPGSTSKRRKYNLH